MTPDQQRIAIAKYCGWKEVEFGVGCNRTLCLGDKPTWRAGKVISYLVDQPVPNYLNDLNAMHEAEKTILKDYNTGYAYDCALNEICECWEDGIMNYMKLWHATATQRAEAFLRAVGKWVD